LTAPHVLRVEEDPQRFAPLLAAIAAAGLRAGWLELRQPEAAAASLEAAAALGALRAVAAGGGRSVAVKPLRGEPVLRDLLREHFRGCALVLVRGAPRPALAQEGASPPPPAPASPPASAQEPAPEPAAALSSIPALYAEGEGWRIARPGDAAAELLDTARLVAALRRPHPWGSS
jgi:hypothetical protein